MLRGVGERGYCFLEGEGVQRNAGVFVLLLRRYGAFLCEWAYNFAPFPLTCSRAHA